MECDILRRRWLILNEEVSGANSEAAASRIFSRGIATRAHGFTPQPVANAASPAKCPFARLANAPCIAATALPNKAVLAAEKESAEISARANMGPSDTHPARHTIRRTTLLTSVHPTTSILAHTNEPRTTLVAPHSPSSNAPLMPLVQK